MTTKTMAAATAASLAFALVSMTALPQDAHAGPAVGAASYYGKRFQGRRTASGERFNMNAMTAAHRTLPFGTNVKVTNRENGRTVVVRINDRGPFAGKRIIDLSRAAASKLGMIREGVVRVAIEVQ